MAYNNVVKLNISTSDFDDEIENAMYSFEYNELDDDIIEDDEPFGYVDSDRLVGHTVHCMGISATIAVVYSAEHYDGMWDIEFRDTKGILRNWKQEFDGGYLD